MDRRILITGSRDWTDYNAIAMSIVGEIESHLEDVVIVHGAAPGADSLAGDFARAFNYTEERHPAQWEVHGKAAGPIRNQKMVDLGADVCLAFPLPQSRGTYDCMRRAEEAGIPVKVFNAS